MRVASVEVRVFVQQPRVIVVLPVLAAHHVCRGKLWRFISTCACWQCCLGVLIGGGGACTEPRTVAAMASLD